ncbi:type VI secretion system amidase effector protein Tae4 [Roseibium sp.]|uniref:type VI secretion system amidase effector protein Tae4 n=1 Tax=Roseibium sp. TaxID=1936156 RepID=UPI003B519908
MPTVKFQDLWDSHPYPVQPCDGKLFKNQCAIRMSVALRGAGVNLDSFRGAKCYPGLKHSPRHILRAEELAKWMKDQTLVFGTHSVHRKANASDFADKSGIVFIKDGWESGGDHIDVWNGRILKGGENTWFTLGKQVWFWEIS